MAMLHKSAVDRESCISALWVRGRLRFVGRGHSVQASINGSRAGPISALGAYQDLVDHRDRAVAPDLNQEDLARGGDPARERRDVHLMGNQDNGLLGLARRSPKQCAPSPRPTNAAATRECALHHHSQTLKPRRRRPSHGARKPIPNPSSIALHGSSSWRESALKSDRAEVWDMADAYKVGSRGGSIATAPSSGTP